MRCKRWRIAGFIGLLIIILILVVPCTDYDASRNIWNGQSLGGFSFTCLKDRTKGLVCWFYVGEQYVGHWPVGKSTIPIPYPTATPYPTHTPYPTYTPPGMQSA